MLCFFSLSTFNSFLTYIAYFCPHTLWAFGLFIFLQCLRIYHSLIFLYVTHILIVLMTIINLFLCLPLLYSMKFEMSCAHFHGTLEFLVCFPQHIPFNSVLFNLQEF